MANRKLFLQFFMLKNVNKSELCATAFIDPIYL